MMRNQSDYWSAWMAGWMMAARVLLEAQQRMIERFMAPLQRREAEPPPPPARRHVETAVPASAGDKPSPVRRGRPPKERRDEAPRRRRGRPPKKDHRSKG